MNMVSRWSFFLLLGSFFVCGHAACPTIISRAQWGARPPKSTPQTLSVPVPYTIIHHGESASCTTQTECANIVRAYQDYHMDTNGWDDIGYNFVVGEDGNVYEGRGWNAVGAHAAPYNTNSIGICIIGSFTNSLPNQAARNAVQNLIQCGVDSNKIQGSYKLLGHRQASSTDCPGNALYNEIKTWPHWATEPKSVNGDQIA